MQASRLVSCASHAPWSSPSRRSTTARTCCRASRSVYRIYDSCASVPMAVRLAFQLTNGQDAGVSAPATTTTAPSPEWWWPSLGNRAPRHPSACRASLGPFNIPLVKSICVSTQFIHYKRLFFGDEESHCVAPGESLCHVRLPLQQEAVPEFLQDDSQWPVSRPNALAKLVKHFGWTWIGGCALGFGLRQQRHGIFPGPQRTERGSAWSTLSPSTAPTPAARSREWLKWSAGFCTTDCVWHWASAH